jgi:hypothetical protein
MMIEGAGDFRGRVAAWELQIVNCRMQIANWTLRESQGRQSRESRNLRFAVCNLQFAIPMSLWLRLRCVLRFFARHSQFIFWSAGFAIGFPDPLPGGKHATCKV